MGSCTSVLQSKSVISIWQKIKWKAKWIIIEGEGEGPHIASNDLSVPQKLKQGVVNMSSTLHNEAGKESNQTLWDSGEKVKANANTQVDAYHDKTSAKDRRKQRQDLEKSRKELAKLQQTEQNVTKAGVSYTYSKCQEQGTGHMLE